MRLRSDLRALRQRASERRAASRIAPRQAADQRFAENDLQILVYFSDEPAHLYQLRRWLDSLARLNETRPVAIVTRYALTAEQLLKQTHLPVYCSPRHLGLDPLIARNDIRLVLYVNHHKGNLAMLWHPDPVHVYIGHGESDKYGISASNQLKAYDYTFVSGQVAVDRVKRRLYDYDADTRLLRIGRPWREEALETPQLPQDDRTVVLYAPSWEGDRDANCFGSVLSHGKAIVDGLLNDSNYRLVFRPHPLTGQRSSVYREAAAELMVAIDAANSADTQAGHVIDKGAELSWQFHEADIAIADISAVTTDWLATGKPLLVTAPDESVIRDPDGIDSRLPLLSTDEAADIVKAIDTARSDGRLAAQAQVVQAYFDETDPDRSQQLFEQAISTLIDRRRAQQAAR